MIGSKKMKFTLLTFVTSILFTATLSASPMSADQCWTSFEKAPEGLVSLCKLSAKTTLANAEAGKVYFFEAQFEDKEEFYLVADAVNPIGGKCFWAEGFKIYNMELGNSDAIELGFLKFCDENGQTENKLTGTLPGGLEIVTSGK